jgi:glyoxylase-like metal-dependent hydrolase (beta-lactamase superfamily II)
MNTATTQPEVIDLHWMGAERRIASWRVGDVLIDSGPATTVQTLLDGLGAERPRALLLTHIHFDHAGGAGELVARWPDLEVVVHERGARHLADPERLEASARRVFGAQFDERFGTLTPIPEANLTVVSGGEVVHGMRVLATPGHAVHHVAYLDESTGRAFPGDVAAVRLTPDGPILAPTPPPDIDIDAWLASIQRLREAGPTWLGLPHFGGHEDPGALLDGAEESVRAHAQAGERLDCDSYVGWARDQLADAADAYDSIVPLAQNWQGLARWLRRRAEPSSGSA